MYEIPKNTPNHPGQARVLKKYEAARGEQTNQDNLHWVSVDTFRIGNGNEILFTDGLNACTGLTLRTENLTFAAHFSHDYDPQDINTAIRREITADEIKTAEVKVCLGSWPDESQSLNVALKTLFKLGLLDNFIAKVQEFLRTLQNVNANERMRASDYNFVMSEIPQILWTNIRGNMQMAEFLNLTTISWEFEIKRIAQFLNKIKENFVGAKNSPLEKIEFEAMVSTEDTISLEKDGPKLEL